MRQNRALGLSIELAVWLVVAVAAALPVVFMARRTGIEEAIIERGGNAIVAVLALLLPIFVVLVEGTSPLQTVLRRFVPFAIRGAGTIDAREQQMTLRARPRRGLRVREEEAWLQLVSAADRSEKLADDASRRSNVHLLLGAFVGLSGLLFFYFMTGARFLPPIQNAAWPAIIANLANALPRMTILVFVELMAMFFLKQYRAAMEEFRYYEEVLRYREAALFAYLAAASDKRTELIALAHELLNRSSFGVLKDGETTAVLEAARLSDNELTELVKAAATVVEHASKLKERATSKIGKRRTSTEKA